MAAFWNVSKELLRSEELSGKMLLVLAYLRIFASYINEVRISVVWLVQNLGYRPKSGHGNINDQIKNILLLLRDRGAVKFDDLGATTQQIRIQLIPDHPYFNPQGGFVQITNEELDKIVSCSYSRKDWLITLFIIMKSHMYFNPRDQNYGVAYPALRTIQMEASGLTKITHNSISKVLALLVEIGLLNTYSVGNYVTVRYGKETLQAFPNFYIVGNQDIDPEECIRLAREQLRSRGIDVEKFIPRVTVDVIPRVTQKEDFAELVDFDYFPDIPDEDIPDGDFPVEDSWGIWETGSTGKSIYGID